MPRTDTEMVEEALRRVSHIGSQRGRARAIGVSDSTVRRWDAGEIAIPLRPDTREPLERFLAGDAGERATEPPADQPTTIDALRLEVIRRIAAGHIDETTLRVLASAPEVRRLGAPERHAEPEADGEHGERDLGPAQKPER